MSSLAHKSYKSDKRSHKKVSTKTNSPIFDRRSQTQNDETISNRKQRQGNGGGFMVFGSLMYNGDYKLIKINGTFNSKKYIEIINNDVIPWLSENFHNNDI